MSDVYFVSDTHFDHANIILYCDRPFLHNNSLDDNGDWVSNKEKAQCCSCMNEVLIDNWNSMVDPNDVVYHLGDFGFGSGCFEKFKDKLNGNINVLRGNHDSNNGVKTYWYSGVLVFGGLDVFVKHIPPINPEEIPSKCDLVLSGHVHNKWKYQIVGNVPIINLSVDVWDYAPVSTPSILKFYDKLKKKGK